MPCSHSSESVAGPYLILWFPDPQILYDYHKFCMITVLELDIEQVDRQVGK